MGGGEWEVGGGYDEGYIYKLAPCPSSIARLPFGTYGSDPNISYSLPTGEDRTAHTHRMSFR